MKFNKASVSYIAGGVIAASLLTGWYFTDKYRENIYLCAKKNYINAPNKKHKEDFLEIIEDQNQSIFSKPFDRDNKEEIILTAIKLKDYDFIDFLITFLPEWNVSQIGSPNNVSFFETYNKIGKKITELDSTKLSKRTYNIKIAYAINTMPINDFYQKYSEDILNNTQYNTLASYIQIVFEYLGCRQETLVWKDFSQSDTPVSLSKYELPDIKSINQNEYFKQKSDLLSGKVPDISNQCKQRLEHSGNVVLEFSNGRTYNF